MHARRQALPHQFSPTTPASSLSIYTYPFFPLPSPPLILHLLCTPEKFFPMEIKGKLLLSFLLFLSVSLLLNSSALSYKGEDPERRLKQCMQECQQLPPGEQQQQLQCQRRCEERYLEDKQRQEQGRDEQAVNEEDPDQELQQSRSYQQDPQQRKECERRCEDKYGKERDEATREYPEERLQKCRQECRSQHREASQRQQCERRCEEEYEKERQGRREEGDEVA